MFKAATKVRDNMGGLLSYGLRIFLLFTLLTAARPAYGGPWPAVSPDKYAPPSRDNIWRPEKWEKVDPIPDEVLPGLTPDLSAHMDNLTLTQLVDVALRNSPVTGQTWADARSAAAAWGRARSDYYPYLDGEVDGAAGKIARSAGGRSYAETGLGLEYLLLDFGRKPGSDAARQALIAANWNHNQAVVDLLRNVPQAYYTHLNSMAQLEATEKTLAEARTTLEATEQRRKSGVSTIADVLQARASEQQVLVNLASDRSAVEITRGQLATVVGWPANTRFEIAKGPDGPPIMGMGKSVDKLIEVARKGRPDMNSAIAAVRQKEAELKKAERAPFPTLTGSGNLLWQGNRSFNDRAYYGGVQLKLPLFHGFDFKNQARQAKDNLDAAKAAFRSKEDSVIQDVWSSFYNFRTARQQLTTSRAVLASARESYHVSLARYKAGAADIVELLNAQSMLAHGRAQVVDAEMNLYTTYADLIHAVGTASPGESGSR